MTHQDRVSAVAALGFTERQADFLVHVMLHSGVCLGRQYCTFAGIARGQKMVDFLQKLVSRRYATPYLCGHNKARVYHVHNVKLYDAIGQRDARFRKRTTLARAIERLMILDHVIAHRDLTWLGAEQDKVAHFLTHDFAAAGGVAASGVRARRRTSPFGTFPTSCRSACRPTSASMSSCTCCWIPCLMTSASFLRRHAELLRALPAWSIRLMVPTGIDTEVVDAYQQAFREELATPLHPQVAERAAMVLSGGGRDDLD